MKYRRKKNEKKKQKGKREWINKWMAGGLKINERELERINFVGCLIRRLRCEWMLQGTKGKWRKISNRKMADMKW